MIDRGQQIQIKLPAPSHKGAVSVEEAIAKRRSIRRYRTEPLSLSHLSQVLWAAQGLTDPRGLRAVPSAGATFPLEVLLVAGEHSVVNLEGGLYAYVVDTHSLGLYRRGDVRAKLAAAALEQSFIAKAPVDIVVCALYQRTCYRYGRRGERYVHMEAGHVGQNIHLQAAALGLATVMVGAFDDAEVQKVLGLEEQFKPLYIMPLGKSL